MASNDAKEEGSYRWSDDDVKIFCEICIKHISDNGRGQPFIWPQIHAQFEELIKRKCPIKSMKNKCDAMKKDWSLWKTLKNGETGIGWDPHTGRISASEEWWQKKVSEAPGVKKFRNKPLLPMFEDLYSQMFDGKLATDENVVAPSIDPSSVQVTGGGDGHDYEEDNGLDNIGSDDAYSQYTHYSSRLVDLETQEQNFYGNFLKEVGFGSQGPNQSLDSHTQAHSVDPSTVREGGKSSATHPTHGENVVGESGAESSKQPKTSKLKRKRRQSGGSAIMQGQIGSMVMTCNRALELLEADVKSPNDGNNSSRVKDSNISAAMDIVNRMVHECSLIKGSELWCFLIHLLEDGVKRDLFLAMGDDDDRMAWLKYLHEKEN